MIGKCNNKNNNKGKGTGHRAQGTGQGKMQRAKGSNRRAPKAKGKAVKGGHSGQNGPLVFSYIHNKGRESCFSQQ